MTCMQQIVHPDARQADIAALLREKRSNKLIAKELGISHFKVRNHVTILLRRLDVETRDRIAEQW